MDFGHRPHPKITTATTLAGVQIEVAEVGKELGKPIGINPRGAAATSYCAAIESSASRSGSTPVTLPLNRLRLKVCVVIIL